MAGPSTPTRRSRLPAGNSVGISGGSSDNGLKRSFPSTPSPSKQLRRPRAIIEEDEEDLPLIQKGKGKGKEELPSTSASSAVAATSSTLRPSARGTSTTRFFTSRLSSSDTSDDEEHALLPSTPTRRLLPKRSAAASSSSSTLTPLSSVKKKGKKRMRLGMDEDEDEPEQAGARPSSFPSTAIATALNLTSAPTLTPPRSSGKSKAYRVKGNVTPSRAFALFKPRPGRAGAGALGSSSASAGAGGSTSKAKSMQKNNKVQSKRNGQGNANLRSEDSALAGPSLGFVHDADVLGGASSPTDRLARGPSNSHSKLATDGDGDTFMEDVDNAPRTPIRRKPLGRGMKGRLALMDGSSCEEDEHSYDEDEEKQLRTWQQATPAAAAGHILPPSPSSYSSPIRSHPRPSNSTVLARLPFLAAPSLVKVPFAARHLVTHENAANTLYRMRTAGVGGMGSVAFGRMGLFDGGRLGKVDLQEYFSRFRSDPVSGVYHIPHRPISNPPDNHQGGHDEEEHTSPRVQPISISSDAENNPPAPTRQTTAANTSPALPPAAPSLGHPLCCAYSYSSSHVESEHQWLAIGAGDGRVSLIDTSCDMETSEPYDWDFWQMGSNDGLSGRPSWQASDASIFILSWRHDDRILATGSSDYELRLWDTQSSECLGRYTTYSGSSRQIAWDPHGNGNLLCSGGRDGAIHIYDVRTSTPASATGLHCEFETGDPYEMYDTHHFDSCARKPVLSLWNVHTDNARTFSMLDASYPKNLGRKAPPKGVTAVAYVPGREHCVVSGACVDATVKMWDIRGVSAPIAAQVKLGKDDDSKPKMSNASKARKSKTWKPAEETDDLSSRDGLNKRSHGISSMVTSKDKIFSACTDGRIYTIPTSSLYESLNVTQGSGTPLYSDIQRQNTLYAKMALSQDERMLAIGCNSGDVMLWDVGRDGLTAKEGVRLHDDCNAEINGVSWASGLRGTTLASIADDLSIRCWRADR